jgi:hypothetical protein
MTPLKTCFRYKDEFQLIPIDSKFAPVSPYAQHFPLFLEYYIDIESDCSKSSSETVLYEMTARQNKETELTNILSVLSNHRFFKYQSNRNEWAVMTPCIKIEYLTKEQQDRFNNQYSSWVIGGYVYPNLKNELHIDTLSKTNFPPTTFISPYYQYFTDNPIENEDGKIRFPETIISCLDSYYSLSDKTKQKVKSCIYLACDGIDIVDQKRSLAFLSYVSAIEGLTGLEIADDEITFECNNCKAIKESPYHCTKCGKPIWGIKTKFVEFLAKFVAGSEKSIQTYKEIYNIRCKITHQNQLFTGDYDMSLDESKLALEHKDWMMRLKTLQLFRISLSNWLRYPDKKKK